jgi:hypothetical protein
MRRREGAPTIYRVTRCTRGGSSEMEVVTESATKRIQCTRLICNDVVTALINKPLTEINSDAE